MLTSLLLVVAVALFAASVPLAAQKIPPNRLYGFRTPRTVGDDRVWYPVNKVAGRNGLVTSMAVGLVGVLSVLGVAGFWSIAALVAFSMMMLVGTVVSASNIVNQIDKAGPRIDYTSSFSKSSKASTDTKRAREKLMKKLRKE